MSFQDAVTTVVTKKYADFSGRARRSEFWWFTLAYILATIVALIIDKVLGAPIVQGLLFLGLIVPSIAVTVRRLHDTGRSGWWLLIGFVPLIGAVVLLVFEVLDSEPGTNAYGPSPKGGAESFNQAPNANWGQ